MNPEALSPGEARSRIRRLLEGTAAGAEAAERGLERYPGRYVSRAARGIGPLTAYGKIKSEKGWRTAGHELIDPSIRSAINKGRKDLQKRAKDFYAKNIKYLNDELKKNTDDLKKARDKYDSIIGDLDAKAKGSGQDLVVPATASAPRW